MSEDSPSIKVLEQKLRDNLAKFVSELSHDQRKLADTILDLAQEIVAKEGSLELEFEESFEAGAAALGLAYVDSHHNAAPQMIRGGQLGMIRG
jgi:hypothetical protein